jgi:hypothetical protein
MPAAVDVKPAVNLSSAQEQAVRLSAVTLPDGWTITAENEGSGFMVRVIGIGFVALSAFDRLTHPEQLAAFIERVRRERG